MTRFDFISASNTVLINFHSDHTVSGSGFSLSWEAVAACGDTQTYAASDEFNGIASPNHPNVILNHLDCTYVIHAASNKRIWLEFKAFDLVRDATIDIDLGDGPFVPFKRKQQLNDGIFVSYRNRIQIRLRTGDKPMGNGFQLLYKTCNYSRFFRRCICLTFVLSISLVFFVCFGFGSRLKVAN